MEKFKKVINQYDIAVGEFVETLSQFSQEQINTVPFEGSWTAGQVAQHILKAIHGMPSLLTKGPTVKAERPFDEKTSEIDDKFLNFNIKMKSPDFIKPEEATYDKNELIHSLNETRKGTIEAARDKDLSLLCLAFEMPVWGHLTLYELLAFAQVHTIRHNHQLKNIYQELSKKVVVNK